MVDYFLHVKRIYRYIKIYGLWRTVCKIAGRTSIPLRLDLIFYFFYKKFGKKNIIMLGAGHHAFSTLGYFLYRHTKSRICGLYDPNNEAVLKFSRNFGVTCFLDNGFIDNDSVSNIDAVYIASNHSSHFDYAKFYLERHVDVFIEKPICLSLCDLATLNELAQSTPAKIYSGYNRPFAPAIQQLIPAFFKEHGPFTFTASVIGHVLSPDHWYRNSTEGSRLISNLGHWIDLFSCFLLKKVEKPKTITLSMVRADKEKFSDNLQISVLTDLGDLGVVTFSCRGEPFEGVSEVIVVQRGDLISKIYDFRSCETWIGSQHSVVRYGKKLCGHKEAALQPFSSYKRPWSDIYFSTNLMLQFEGLFQSGRSELTIEFDKLTCLDFGS